MQTKIYTHKGIGFEWGGGLTVFLKGELMPLKLTLNNYSPGWRLSRYVWLSVRQLKKIIINHP